MNRQETYEIVKGHLLSQNKKAMDPKGFSCQYRGKNKTKCAIGALIPDSMYDKNFEGHSVHTLIQDFPEVIFILGAENQKDINFLETLQSIHDDHDVKYWPEVFDNFAKKYKLKP